MTSDFVSTEDVEYLMKNSEMERIHLLALISKLTASVIAPYVQGEDEWNREGGFMLYIGLPSGQVSFHVDTEYVHWFDHVQRAHINPWDMHGDEEKMQRIVNFIGE